MAIQVPSVPALAKPTNIGSFEQLRSYLTSAYGLEIQAFAEIANAINYGLFQNDGSSAFGAPLPLKSYPKASLPAAGSWTAAIVYVTDEAGGATIAFSDGTNWRRVQDRNVVS